MVHTPVIGLQSPSELLPRPAIGLTSGGQLAGGTAHQVYVAGVWESGWTEDMSKGAETVSGRAASQQGQRAGCEGGLHLRRWTFPSQSG